MEALTVSECGCRHVLLAVTLASVQVVAGCQGAERVSVSGRVTRRDGSPVAGCRVVFRSPGTGDSASGVTNDSGYYELGTVLKGDGVPPGEYAVAVTENRGDWDHPKPRTYHAKYESAKTSALTCVVESGADTTFDLELEPPQPIAR